MAAAEDSFQFHLIRSEKCKDFLSIRKIWAAINLETGVYFAFFSFLRCVFCCGKNWERQPPQKEDEANREIRHLLFPHEREREKVSGRERVGELREEEKSLKMMSMDRDYKKGKWWRKSERKRIRHTERKKRDRNKTLRERKREKIIRHTKKEREIRIRHTEKEREKRIRHTEKEREIRIRHTERKKQNERKF